MRRRLLAALVLLVTTAPAAHADPTLLGHHGRWITDGEGRVRILHGIGVMDYAPPNLPAAMGFGAEDADFLAAHGFNLVRLGMNWSGIEPRPGVYDPAYLASVLGTMRLLEARGIYTLLDWHQDDWGVAAAGIDGAPAWATLTDGLPNPPLGYGVGMLGDPAQMRAFDNFWANAPGPGGVGIADRFAAMLAAYATTFRQEPYLLGYDTFNEPNTGTQWPTCAGPAGCPVFDRQLSAWFRKLVPVLRAADPEHLIWIEPNVFFDFAANTNLDDPQGADANTGFDFHTYCLGDGAAAAAPPVPGNGPGCAIEENLNLDNAEAYQRRSGVALLETEWGATNDAVIAARQTDQFDARMLGDVFWDYRNVVPDLKAQPGGKNQNAPLLGALDRPFAPIVAGTPTAWHWDPVAHAFTLRYGTTLPDGRPAAGLTSEVYVPALHYPAGYTVASSGATVTASGATRVALRNEAGANTVSVTVTPGAPAPADTSCTPPRTLSIRVHLHRGERVVRVAVRVDGHRRPARPTRRGTALRLSTSGLAPGPHVVVARLSLRRGHVRRSVAIRRRVVLCGS